jgi:isoquinoline 1-oxidoreductase beta subunit
MSAALDSKSRRAFLRQGAGLSLAVLAGGGFHAYATAAAPSEAFRKANAWVQIAPDGTVLISLGAAEMGQGVMTALPLILAEELDADWSSVRVRTETHDAKTYGNPKIGGLLYTAGSTAMEAYFDTMRKAGATARRVLIHTAARRWGVPAPELGTEPGFVVHQGSRRRMGYGEVVTAELVTDVPAVTDADLKPPAAYRLIGKDIPRVEIPPKTRGAETYSIDVRVPGMVYAAVLRAPVEGESAVTIDDAEARRVTGVVAVVKVPEGVAVVAERWEAALAARARLKVEWTRNSPFRSADSDADLERNIAAAADGAPHGIAWKQQGDALQALAGSGRIVEATYATEHVYHAQLEPLAAVASVDADGMGAEIWIGTQSQSVTLGVATAVLGTTPERIRFNALQMGGGFGRRTLFARELLRDALLLSRDVRRPVKLIWTREDDLRNGWFRPATAHRLRAALDAQGRVTAWHHRVAAPSVMAYYSAENFARANQRDLFLMEGAELSPYRIPNLLAEHLITERRARIAAWRGIGTGHNAFATECFVDELASAARMDPAQFRRNLVGDNMRARAVLDAALEMAKYGTAPQGRAHGLSLAAYRDSVAAAVAEISVDNSSGEIRVHRFWAAVDAGLPIQPRNLVAQIEGGIVFGLSGALFERVTIKDGEVRQSNFTDYRMLRSSEMPAIEVRIVSSSAPPSSAGELGVPITAAAVANAFFALTGKRLTRLPFDADRVQAALGGR